MKNPFYILIVLTLAFTIYSCSREKRDVTGWTSFTGHGLSAGVTALAVDGDDIKWFGTPNGLIRFDGADYTLYNDSNSNLVSNHIYCIVVDRQNRPWVGTDAGVSMFNGEAWTTYLRDTLVRAMAVDLDNHIWFSIQGCGLLEYDGVSRKFYSDANGNLPANFISVIVVDRMNNIWFGDEFMPRVTKYDHQNWVTYTIPNPNPAVGMSGISAIAFDGTGNAWMEVPLTGIFIFDGANWNLTLKNASVHTLAIDHDGAAWAGYHVYWHGGGVSKYTGGNWKNYNEDNSGILDNWVTCIAIDTHGNKWFGTRAGVSEYSN